MGSLASISKENAGEVTVHQADNKIDDPNDVKESTDGIQIKKLAEKKLNKENEKFKLKNELTCDSCSSKSASYSAVITRISFLFELHLDISNN